MKKILLTATMLVGFAAVSQAQQGRVGINTNTPASTLDVVANTTDTTRPDALLVPRMSRAQLEAKDGAYVNGTVAAPGPQNGALVFVTALGGLGTGKTINVTAPGFYYFNATDSVSPTPNAWIAVGGGGNAPNPAPNVRTSNTGNDFTSTDLDGYVFLTGNTADLSVLPATAANKGRSITLVRIGTQNITVTGISSTSVNSITVAGRGLAFVSDGTAWQTYSAQ